VGIVGNEMADAAAKRAAIHGHKPKFKVPFTDLYVFSKRYLKELGSSRKASIIIPIFTINLLIHGFFAIRFPKIKS